MTAATITRTCTVDGCDRPTKARGWCASHHRQYLRSGLPVGRHQIDTTEVLWLLEGGRPIPSICDALGHPDSIARALVRDGHREAARLFTNEARLRKAAA